MNTKHLTPKNDEIVVHDYDDRISRVYGRIEKGLSVETVNLIKKYTLVIVCHKIHQTALPSKY